jgi:hypothetical protein
MLIDFLTELATMLEEKVIEVVDGLTVSGVIGLVTLGIVCLHS